MNKCSMLILVILAILVALSHGMNPDHGTGKEVQSDQGQSSSSQPAPKPSSDQSVVEEFGKLLDSLKAEVEGQFKLVEDTIMGYFNKLQNYQNELDRLFRELKVLEYLQCRKAMEELVKNGEKVPFEQEKPRQKLAELAQFLASHFGAKIAIQILDIKSFDDKFIGGLSGNGVQLDLKVLELKRNALKKEVTEIRKKFREHYGREAEKLGRETEIGGEGTSEA